MISNRQIDKMLKKNTRGVQIKSFEFAMNKNKVKYFVPSLGT